DASPHNLPRASASRWCVPMMTQPRGVPPIDPYGTRQAGRRAKLLRTARRRPQRPARSRVDQGMSQVIPQGTARPGPASGPAAGPAPAAPPPALTAGTAGPGGAATPPGVPPGARAALRRCAAGAAAVSAAALATLSAAPPAASAQEGDRLTVTVRDAGEGLDGTYEVTCRPGRGSHPDPEGACAA